jgi:hypothetical protein
VIFPVVSVTTDRTLNAATEWLLSELGDAPASIETMRERAAKEIARPRDALHREWSETFLKETERYAR